MSTLVAAASSRADILGGELAKLAAFFRRDALTAWSYRMAFVTEWISLAVQVVLFSFVGKMISPQVLPTYGGEHASYLEFASVGIALGAFIQLALARVAVGIRGEQMMGTLESLLMTPTSPTTIQIGTVFYDLLYIPIRTGLFLALAAVVFGLDFHAGGFGPVLLIVLAFIPFVWGLGVMNAGLILTFRRGSGIAAFGATLLTLLSGAFFPLSLLPSWLEGAAAVNPLAIALDGMREALLGGAGWASAAEAAALLTPFSIVSLFVAMYVFNFALRRERRRGSLGIY